MPVGKILNIIILSGGLFFGNLSWGNAQDIRFRGAEDQGHLKLYWETFAWPENLSGFNIKMKESEDKPWVKLNREVIYPQVAPRNWKNLGLNQEQSAAISRVLDIYLSSGDMQAVSKEEMLSRFVKSGGIQAGDRLTMKEDFNIALILGFGFIDNDYKKHKKASYAVFYVDNYGNEADEPAVTFTPEKVKKVRPEVQFRSNRNRISLQWKFPMDQYFQAALYGFKVYRYAENQDNPVFISRKPIGFLTEKGNDYLWQLSDSDADPDSNYTYILTPSTIFQTDYKPIAAKYISKKHKSLPLPEIDTVILKNNKDVVIAWNFDNLEKTEIRKIDHVILEKASADSLSFQEVWRSSSLKSEEFLDTISLTYGSTYFYHLTLIDKDGETIRGKDKIFTYLGHSAPKAPANARAEFKMINDNPYVYLSWEKQNSQNVRGYLLETDELQEGQFLKMGSIPLIEDNNFLFKVDSKGGRKYSFHIIPVGSDGFKGDTVSVSCEVPDLFLPLFNDFKVSLNKQNVVLLTWSYAEEIKLNGFNLLVNDERILSYKTIGSSARSLELKNFKVDNLGKLNRFHLEAVGEGGRSMSMGPSVYLPENQIAVPEIENINLIRAKEEWVAVITWIYPNSENKKLPDFQLFVDESVEGDILPNKILKAPKLLQYEYKIPDPFRDTYTFQLAAISKEGILSPVAEYTLNLAKQKKR